MIQPGAGSFFTLFSVLLHVPTEETNQRSICNQGSNWRRHDRRVVVVPCGAIQQRKQIIDEQKENKNALDRLQCHLSCLS
eukprot:TRINITY_DN17428_c0_g1_i1.p2 TRINITY_DN17428_c0_g1~~TRINITY_DN17428_c0_g1_i1.p2  ORF type:complete len:80 (-),score=14.84 TRINITY_DN17428_c0_g1_i1:224-463(-)